MNAVNISAMIQGGVSSIVIPAPAIIVLSQARLSLQKSKWS